MKKSFCLGFRANRKIGNAHDTHAVAVRNIIDGDIKTVGRVPLKISAPDMRGSIFITTETRWFNPVYCQRELPMFLGFATA